MDAGAEKVARIARDLQPIEEEGDRDAKVLVLGWGSTLGAIRGGAILAREEGLKVATAHLRHLNPFPPGLGELLERYEHVLVPEMNTGQLAFLLQGRFLKKIVSYPKVQGKPFFRSEIHSKIRETLEAGHVN